MRLLGEKDVLDSIELINVSLNETGQALQSIADKSKLLETLTKRLQQMNAELQKVNAALNSAKAGPTAPPLSVPNVPGASAPPGSGANVENLTKQQKALTEEIKKTTTAAASLEKELQGVEKGSDAYREIIARAGKAKVAQRELTAEVREAQREFERTRISFGSYRDLQIQLESLRAKFRLLDDEQKKALAGQEMLKRIKELDATLKQEDANMGIFVRNVGNYSSALSGVASVTSRLAAAFGVTAGVREFVVANEQASDAVADVAKTANLSIESVRKFQEVLKNRDTRTSLVNQLQIAEIGGQLGVAENQLESFTVAVDKTNVALGKDFGNNVEEVTRVTGGLRNVFKELQTVDVGDDILHISNALNVLSADGNATAPIIAEFANRIGGTAIPLGASAKSIFGLSTTLNELNVSAERGGSGVVRILTEIGKAPDKFAKAASIPAAEFRELVERDIVGALALVAKKTKESADGNIALIQTLDELKINGAGELEVFNKLGSAYDLYTKRVDQAGVALSGTASIQDEFDKKNNNFAASIAKVKNELVNLAVSTDFQDFLTSGANGIASFIRNLAALPKFLYDNRLEVYALVAAIVAFNTESILAAFNALRQSAAYLALTDASKRQALAQGIMNSVMKALPLLAVVAGVYAVVKAFQVLTAVTDGAALGAKAFKDAQADIARDAAKESATLNKNFETLKKATSTTQERTAAIKELKNAYPEYLQGMDLEKLSLNELNNLQKDLNDNILASVAARKKAQVQDEFAGQILEKTLRIRAVQEGGAQAATFKEALKFGGGTGFDRELQAQKIIAGLTEEVKQLEIASTNASRAFDGIGKVKNKGTENIAASAINEVQADQAEERQKQAEERAKNAVNLRKLTLAQLEALDSDAAKEEISRRKEADKRLKEAADQRQKDEKTAADNIYKIQQDLIAKTYDGRIQLAKNQTTNAISALVGTPQQIETQKALLQEQLKRTIEDIEKERNKAREKALKDIEAFRRDAALQAANNQSDSAGNQVRAAENLTQVDKINTGVQFTAVQAELDQAFGAGLLTQEEYNRKSEALSIQREARILEIERQGFEAQKTLQLQQQQSQLEVLKLNYQEELRTIEEANAAKFEALKAQRDAGDITPEQFATAENDLRAAEYQARLDAERKFREEQAAIIQDASLSILDTEAYLAEQQAKIDKDTNTQKLANAQATRDGLKAINDAQFGVLSEYISGVSKLLSQDTENRKKYGTVLKALAVAEIAINLRKELSEISLAAIKAGAATGPFGFLVAGGIYGAQAAAAVIKAALNTAGVIAQKFEYGGVIPTPGGSAPVEGGSIPRGSGMIEGRSHQAKGVRAIYNGRLVEFEGGEYHLRNGKETYIINKKATKQHYETLLRLSDKPSQYSSIRKQVASAINASTGGKKFATATTRHAADGGIAPLSPVDIQPLAAPQLNSAQTIVVNAANRDEVNAIMQLAANAAEVAAAANSRIDRLQIILDPLDALIKGTEQAEIKAAQNL
jgi:TP901 family phage tail tape measure protein